jgi:hypothetical protein
MSRGLDWCEASRRSSVFFQFVPEANPHSRETASSDQPQLPQAASPVRSFYNALKSLCSRDQLSVCYLTNAREAFAASGIQKKWLAGSITNFDYIMALNTFAGRSFNDLRQYPVSCRPSASCYSFQVRHAPVFLLTSITGFPMDTVELFKRQHRPQ